MIYNWQLGSGGSYAASYITGSLAVTKYLRGRYVRIGVVGHSQGGLATLINALQSQPDTAVVVSGFSIVSESVELADFHQVVIPDMHHRLSNESIRGVMQKARTRFLFTYGRNERTVYRLEAEEAPTAKFFSGLPNVEVGVHNGGHVFPSEVVRSFIARLWPVSGTSGSGLAAPAGSGNQSSGGR